MKLFAVCVRVRVSISQCVWRGMFAWERRGCLIVCAHLDDGRHGPQLIRTHFVREHLGEITPRYLTVKIIQRFVV